MLSAKRRLPTPERVGVLALASLVVLAVAYLLTVEPSPIIGVRWRDDVSARPQAELERAYLLVDGRAPNPDLPRSVAYTLLDTGRQNIEALVTNPAIADTQFINRQSDTITSDAEKSGRRIWIAHRLPGLRRAMVRRTVILVLATVAVLGLRLKIAAFARVLAAIGIRALAAAVMVGYGLRSSVLFDARVFAVVGIAGLASGALGYWLTAESAASVRVRWRDDVSAARQAELERRYQLVGGGSPHQDAPRALVYSLRDTSEPNVEAIVKDPEIADTSDIDRELYEVQGLRQANARRTLIFVLAGMVIAGLWVVPAARRRIAALREGLRRDSGDLFDTIPSRFRLLAPYEHTHSGNEIVRLLTKSIVGGLVVVAIGVPILDTWDTLLLVVSLLAVIFGVARPVPWRLAAAAVVVIALFGFKSVLPRANIAEAHNAFMVMRDGEPVQQGLPVEVFRSWKAQFDALYPPEVEPYPAFSWRAHSAVPKTLFAGSSDAIWRKAKYTRQVDAIDIRTLPEFRGGFANDMRYNFWAGQLSRESMPFYVMYELTSASVDSSLQWKGQAFWERANGGFEELVHNEVSARSITREDVGKRVYALFLPQRDPQLHFRLDRSLKLRLAAWTKRCLTLIGAVAVLLLTIRPRWDRYLRGLFIFSAGCLLMAWFLTATGGPYLGESYAPQGGGNDGLAHDSYGREMAMLVGRGQLVDAFAGGEAIYWFTPGMRYVRMVEKLIFGDTNLLYALVTACLPLVIFYVIRSLIGTRAAWVSAGLFCVMPVGNVSLQHYIFNARIGYGEAAGCGLFLLGLVLMLRTQAGWGGAERNRPIVGLAGAALAASMFIRPNFALAVAWLGAAHAWTSWRRNDIGSIAALALGLGLALWMPFHNWYYGGRFYLIAIPSTTSSVPLGVSDYLVALSDVLRGRFDTEATALTSAQLRGWLWNPGFVLDTDRLMPLAWTVHAVELFALIVTCWVACRWAAGGFVRETKLAVVAVASILAHAPLLFVYTTDYRYAMLAWTLSLVVLIAWFLPLRCPSNLPASNVTTAH